MGEFRVMRLKTDELTIRRASAADAPAVLRIFDEVIAWFVSIGNEGQWGSEPWSVSPERVQRITDACSLPSAWVAEDAELGICGSIVLGDAMPYVAAATRPENYVLLLIASRDPRVRGIGLRLMAFADEQTRAAGLNYIRVDCYGGGDGSLVRFYERCGYKRLSTFDVEGWPGQLLERYL